MKLRNYNSATALSEYSIGDLYSFYIHNASLDRLAKADDEITKKYSSVISCYATENPQHLNSDGRCASFIRAIGIVVAKYESKNDRDIDKITVMFNTNDGRCLLNTYMRAYFDGTVKELGHHTWLNMDQNGISREDVCTEMEKLRNAIIDVEGGKLYGNEIFYVESCVYLMTLYDLLSCGCLVWLVYDCFYASSLNKETEQLFEEMIQYDVKQNFENFLKLYWR